MLRMVNLIDRAGLLNQLCEKCGGGCDADKEKRCWKYKLIMEQSTIEPEVQLIPKEVSATDIDKLTEMIKVSLLQAYPNDVMFTAVRHGRWIVHTTWHGMFGLIHSECSECKFDRNGDLSSWKFCPNCGARMDLRTPTEVELDIADSVMGKKRKFRSAKNADGLLRLLAQRKMDFATKVKSVKEL